MAFSTIALLWLGTAINWQGARAAGRFQVVTLLIKLIPLVTVVILIPVAFGRSEPIPITPFPAEGLSLAAVSGSAILTLWALLGFESASVAADKVDNPTTNIPRRSEEHTSELQSLMRNSYAVFCLKKKNNEQHHPEN